MVHSHCHSPIVEKSIIEPGNSLCNRNRAISQSH